MLSRIETVRNCPLSNKGRMQCSAVMANLSLITVYEQRPKSPASVDSFSTLSSTFRTIFLNSPHAVNQNEINLSITHEK